MGGGGCQGSDCKGCSGKGHSRAKKEREYRGCDGEVNRFYFDFIFYHLLIPKTKQLSTVVSACPEKKKKNTKPVSIGPNKFARIRSDQYILVSMYQFNWFSEP